MLIKNDYKIMVLVVRKRKNIKNVTCMVYLKLQKRNS